MTVADILDGGFAVLKARPRRILASPPLFVVPTQLLAAFLQRDAMGGFGFADVFSEDPTVINEQADATRRPMFAGAARVGDPRHRPRLRGGRASAHLVSQWVMGRDAPAGEMLGVIGRRWWALLGSFVIVKLAEGGGRRSAATSASLFVMALFVPVAPIIGVEGGGPLDAVSRSVRLTRARYFPTLGIAVLMGLVSSLLNLALSALPQALAAWIGLDAGWPLLAAGGDRGARSSCMPFVAAATVLLYFDLRVRTEGLDLEMSAIDVLDRAA